MFRLQTEMTKYSCIVFAASLFINLRYIYPNTNTSITLSCIRITKELIILWKELHALSPPPKTMIIFTRESSNCFQRILAITILSVCLSVTRVDQSKTVQARITKSSPSAAWKTLVSGTVKLFHKFEGGSPRTRALNERGWAKFAIFGQ